MKKTIKLTESDLIKMVKRVIKERKEKSLVDEYIDMMDIIVSEYYDGDNYENVMYDLGNLVTSAEKDLDLTDEDIDEIYDYYDEITSSLDIRP